MRNVLIIIVFARRTTLEMGIHFAKVSSALFNNKVGSLWYYQLLHLRMINSDVDKLECFYTKMFLGTSFVSHRHISI